MLYKYSGQDFIINNVVKISKNDIIEITYIEQPDHSFKSKLINVTTGKTISNNGYAIETSLIANNSLIPIEEVKSNNEDSKTIEENNSEEVITNDNIEEAINDNVSHPSHYTQGSIECIDAMLSAYGVETVMHFCQCNAFKYLWRFNRKNKIEDLDKSLWYINKYKELNPNETN